MVILNYSTMEMVAKIVYYGPGLGGKTTNLQTIHARTSNDSRGELVSLATETDRTLFFDLLPMDVGIIGGFKAKFQLYTVPGQVFYNTTRKLVLKGVDGLVFVADSQVPMMDANRESFQNLRDNLAELNLTVHDRPIVLQYNKRDIPKVLTIEQLERTLNPEGFPYVEASAINGIGVFETLREISKLTLTQILSKNLGKEGSKPARPIAPKRPPQPEPEPMPEANFDEAVPPRKLRTPSTARDSFERTLDNLDLDLSDDDDAFLEEDSLDMEDFDAWDEEDSLDNSQEAIGEDTSPGDDEQAPAVDDSDVMPTLDFDALHNPGGGDLDDILEMDDDTVLAVADEDASLERQVDAALRSGPSHELDFSTDTPWETPDEIELGDDLEFPDGLELDGDTDYGEAAGLSLDGDTDYSLSDSIELDLEPASGPAEVLEASAPLELDPALTAEDPSFSVDLGVDDPFNLAGPSLELEPNLDELDAHLDGLEDSLGALEESISDLEPLGQAEPAEAPATGFALIGDPFDEDDLPEEDEPHQAYDFAAYGDEESLDLPLAAITRSAAEPPSADAEPEAPEPDLGLSAFDDDMEVDAYLASGDLDDEDVLTSADLEGELGLDFDVEASFDSADLEDPEPAVAEELPEPPVAAPVAPSPAPAPAPPMPVAAKAPAPAPAPPMPVAAKAPAPPTPVAAKAPALHSKPAHELDLGDIRKKPKVSSGLDELKRLTTRIQTSKIPRLKEADLGDLLGDALGDKDKKAKPDKFTVKLPTSFEKAQINCVFVDEDGNVVHTELFEVNARKLEDGKYQVRVVIDAELDE